MSGPTGEYTIESSGVHPQAGWAYLYKDNKYTFYFYIDLKPGTPQPGKLTLVVQHLSNERFGGGRPVIDRGDVSTIEENIRHYLTTVSYRPRPPEPVPTVTFTWRVGQ
jgi:hypothetical protein